MFPQMVETPTAFPQVDANSVPLISALVSLVEAVPNDLLVLKTGQYAELTASTAFLRALPVRFQASRGSNVAPMSMTGFDRNPIAMIYAALAACQDEAPATGTALLAFIEDPQLRESIRLDISAARQNLGNGEWKGTTVLAGSAAEALLLAALQHHDKGKPGSVQAAVVALLGSKVLKRDPGTDLEGIGWGLHEYVEVAAHIGIVKPDTATATRLAKEFRNFIHPGRAARLRQKCDQGTALSALAAVYLVVRDLTPP
jgi:hypothetical protein